MKASRIAVKSSSLGRLARAEIGDRANASSAILNSPAQIIARYANDHHDIKRIAIELMLPESQIPIASQAASRRFAIRLALFYGAIFGLLGSYLPFFPVWLKAVGIEASWIGIITAVPAVTRFTVLPFVTGLAERRQLLRNAIIITAFATHWD
jgi:hypothetical protein